MWLNQSQEMGKWYLEQPFRHGTTSKEMFESVDGNKYTQCMVFHDETGSFEIMCF
jgi:hypothetical protein